MRLFPTQAPPHPCCFLALRPLCGQPTRYLAASSLLRPLRPPTLALGLSSRCAGNLSRQPPFLDLPLRLGLAVALAAARWPKPNSAIPPPITRHWRSAAGSAEARRQPRPELSGQPWPGLSSSAVGGAAGSAEAVLERWWRRRGQRGGSKTAPGLERWGQPRGTLQTRTQNGCRTSANIVTIVAAERA
jgi:hypothetical protein